MKNKILLISLVLSFVLLASPALAVGKPNTILGKPSKVGSTAAAGRPSGLPTQAQNRLTEAKLKTCQAKENSIKTRFEHLNQLVTTMEEKFDAIAGRIEEYYTTNVVPSRKTVSNYDSLVADIAASKTTVQTGLTKTQNDIADFSCGGADPKAQLTAYRLDMQGVIQELKDYRTSIKDLIVAVRSVTGTTERANPSVSPKPTEKP